MTSNFKVVDVIEEGKQEENETVEAIPEEVKNERVVEQLDEIVSAPPEQPQPEPKKKEPPIAIDQPVKQNVRQQDKLVKCPQCDKQMKLKSYRYKHELTCKGKLEDIPRKPKAMPKPKAHPIEQEEVIQQDTTIGKTPQTFYHLNQIIRARHQLTVSPVSAANWIPH